MESTTEQPLNPWLLEILVCPESKAPLIRQADWLYSTDAKTRRRYRIQDGIPNMLIEESEVVSEEEFDRMVRRRSESMPSQEGES